MRCCRLQKKEVEEVVKPDNNSPSLAFLENDKPESATVCMATHKLVETLEEAAP